MLDPARGGVELRNREPSDVTNRENVGPGFTVGVQSVKGRVDVHPRLNVDVVAGEKLGVRQ